MAYHWSSEPRAAGRSWDGQERLECGGRPSAVQHVSASGQGAMCRRTCCDQLPAPPQSSRADAEDRSWEEQAWRSLSEWRFNGTIVVTLWQWSTGWPSSDHWGPQACPSMVAYEEH